MKTYLDLLKTILEHGHTRGDRTGVGTKSLFGPQLRYDLAQGFPLLTTKKLHTPSIITELIWFIRGDTNIRFLNDHGVTIWDEWADPKGDLGPIYGQQWRHIQSDQGPIDQLKDLIYNIQNDPHSRRHILASWNVAELHHMALPPCHCLTQFYVQNDTLSCHLYQRSADVFLGVPFNIASYALLTAMIAAVCKLKPHTLIHTFGDAHLYLNHIPQAREQLSRQPRDLPTLILNPRDAIEDFRPEDIRIEGYHPHPHIPATIAV